MGRKRNSRLIAKRNKKLCARYYYWTEVQRLRFDDAIHQLSEEEFFLSEATIISILKRMQRISEDELRDNASLKLPAKMPTITKDMLSFMQDKLPADTNNNGR